MTTGYSMLTFNANAHPLLSLMHRPNLEAVGAVLPAAQHEKRAIVSLERGSWNQSPYGTQEEAATLVQLPAPHLYAHGAADAVKHVELHIQP